MNQHQQPSPVSHCSVLPKSIRPFNKSRKSSFPDTKHLKPQLSDSMLLDKRLSNPSFNIYFIDFQYVNLVRQTFWIFFARHRVLYLTMLIDFATIMPQLSLFVRTSILKPIAESRSFLHHYSHQCNAVDYGALFDFVLDNIQTNRCLRRIK